MKRRSAFAVSATVWFACWFLAGNLVVGGAVTAAVTLVGAFLTAAISPGAAALTLLASPLLWILPDRCVTTYRDLDYTTGVCGGHLGGATWYLVVVAMIVCGTCAHALFDYCARRASAGGSYNGQPEAGWVSRRSGE